MIKTVGFIPRYVAENITFDNSFALVSITDIGQIPATIHSLSQENLLRLEFIDLHSIEMPEDKSKVFNHEKAQILYGFIHTLHARHEELKLLVHCEAGVSRSAAVALFVQAYTECDFPRRHTADLANRLVVSIMQEIAGIKIEIPASPEYSELILPGNIF